LHRRCDQGCTARSIIRHEGIIRRWTAALLAHE
jgi:hypothetical protein